MLDTSTVDGYNSFPVNESELRTLLKQVLAGEVSVDDAVSKLRLMPFQDIGFASVDHHRLLRCGFPEIIYCPGKTVEQVVEIFSSLCAQGANVIASRASEEVFQAVSRKFPAAEYHSLARIVTLQQEQIEPVGHVAVVAAGTSDLPVAEEARIIAEIMGSVVSRHYDVGVAGLHRLLGRVGQLQQAKVIVVVAGMEGALPSVVGGLVSVPVIAVPTSVGYGANLGGLTAMLAMLNSCTPNVSVVNIDNGISAGCIAAIINKQSSRSGKTDDSSR